MVSPIVPFASIVAMSTRLSLGSVVRCLVSTHPYSSFLHFTCHCGCSLASRTFLDRLPSEVIFWDTFTSIATVREGGRTELACVAKRLPRILGVMPCCIPAYAFLVLFGVLTSFDNTDYNSISPFRLAWHVSSSSAAFRANGPAGVLSFCACIPAVFPLVQLFPFFQKSSFTVLLFGRVSLTSSNC